MSLENFVSHSPMAKASCDVFLDLSLEYEITQDCVLLHIILLKYIYILCKMSWYIMIIDEHVVGPIIDIIFKMLRICAP